MISSLKPYSFFLSLIIFSLTLLSIKGNCQVRGTVLENISNTPIPFVHISINDGQYEILADLDGNFEIPLDSGINKLTFESYLHRKVVIFPDSTIHSVSMQVRMNKYIYFEFEDTSSQSADDVMNQVIENKKDNKTNHLKNISYSTYNKATLTPLGDVDKTNLSLKNILKFFALKHHQFNKGQHFLIVESATQKKIYNKHHDKEVIIGAKSTILDVPSLFIQTTQIQTISPYDDFINVGGKTYVSPLTEHTLTRYAFSILDTVNTLEDTIYVVKYNPLPNKKFDGLKGLFFINTKNYAVQYFLTEPSVDKKVKMSAVQSYKYYPENNVWFLDRTQTKALIEKSGEVFLATLNTYTSDIKFNDFHSKKHFDEIALEYPEYANKQTGEFWNEKRIVPLSLQDSNTYIYHDSIDQKKFIQRTLQFGEELYYGIIPYKILDIDLIKVFDVNRLEGPRLGFGAHTNKKLSRRFIFGFYYGYGLHDERSKIGTDATYKFRKLPISIGTSLTNDVFEAGGIYFPFNSPQYSSENLRRFRLRIMDRVMEWRNFIDIHPLKYLDVRASFSVSRNSTTYDYQYKDVIDGKFNYSELSVGFRYAIWEKIIKLPTRKIIIESKYPKFYFQYTRGFNNFLNGQYSFNKYDFKFEYNFKVKNLGKTGIQLITGMVDGDAPYSKLYNGNGSYKSISVVIHNTFETMQYNEFLMDKYFSLFISHNFGKLYFENSRIRPSLLLLQNIGFGYLRNPQVHKSINFKTMEKGYFESGLLLDNIIVFNLAGLKVGIGAGFFYRYGPNANPETKDNLVFKFATSFNL